MKQPLLQQERTALRKNRLAFKKLAALTPDALAALCGWYWKPQRGRPAATVD